MTINDLPDILTAPIIAEHQKCASQTIYVLLRKNPKAGGIPSYQFGRSRRVHKIDYVNWLEARKKESEARFDKRAR